MGACCLEHKISGGCHEDHGKDHTEYVNGGYGLDPFLERLDLYKLFICRFALDLRADLTKFGIASSKDRAEYEGDQTENRADAKADSGV
jgi:hypothetical protein